MNEALALRKAMGKNDIEFEADDHDTSPIELTGVHKLNADAKDPLRRAAQTAAMRGFIKRDAPSQKAHKLVAADAKTPCSEEELKKFARPCMFDDDLIYRMLLSRNGDFASASKRWYKLAQVLNDIKMDDFNELTPKIREVAEAAQAWQVFENPDKHGHPILFINPAGLDWSKVDIEDVKHAVMFMMMKAMRQNEYYAQVSGIIMYADMGEFSFSNMNSEYNRFTREAFHGALPGKFAAFFPCDGGFFFNIVFPIFAAFMPAKLKERIHVPTDKPNKKKNLPAYHELREWMHPSEIVEHHGGTYKRDYTVYMQRLAEENEERLLAMKQAAVATVPETTSAAAAEAKTEEKQKHADPTACVA